jgi:Mg2+ and Co2+ transporter CorA
MQAEFALHPLAIEDARHGHQRPKIEEYGDSLFAVLHIVEPVEAEFQVAEVHVFAGPNYVLTVRSQPSEGFTKFANVVSASRSYCATAPATCSMPWLTRWSTDISPSLTAWRVSSRR